MRLTLIYPLLSKERSRVDENKQYWPPLGLAYIAAVLRENGHIVQILDRDYIMRRNNFDFDKTDKVTFEFINKFGSELVGFSATTPNVSDVRIFSQKLKKKKPALRTVIGGPHCIGEPVLTLEMCDGIDILARGEGEMAMLEIANGSDLDKIGGLTYRTMDGKIFSNPDRQLIESLDDLPYPARDLLDMDFYTRPSRFISRNLSLRTTHIFTARGCPYNCNYCAGPLMGRRKVRYHSPQRVVGEIEELIHKYSIEAVYFAEDMFLSNKKRAMDMCRLFVDRGIHKRIVWMAQLSTIVADEELLLAMKKSGCVHVEYGFESGSQRVLELMNKMTNIAKNIDTAYLTRKVGLRFQGNFIVGYPGEKEDDFNQTVGFIKKVKPNNVSLNLFMPLPGTEIYKKLKETNHALSNWDDFGNPEASYINYADMPVNRFEELYLRAKLKVVLPMNLAYFIKDNIFHPLRLLYVIFTQFKSVLSRMIKAFGDLYRLKRIKKDKKEANILFVAYHAASLPIMDSQGLPYMKGLADKGAKFSLLTYETSDSLAQSAACLKNYGFDNNWVYLTYHKKPRFLATLLDIVGGIVVTFSLLKKNKVNLVHARGVIPGIISFFPAKFLKIGFFFDSRGLLADKYVGGGLIRHNGLNYWLLRIGEGILLKGADYFTVETDNHAKIIAGSYKALVRKMMVIPSCVDLEKFNYSPDAKEADLNNKFDLVYLGKIGTWYLIDEMFSFFKRLSNRLPNARFVFITQDRKEDVYLYAERAGVQTDKVAVLKADRRDIPALLAKSHAGIYFINNYKRYNSSPIKYAEYLACGLPVVINSGIGDTQDITESARVGVVVGEKTDKEYSRAVDAFISLIREGEPLRARCRNTAAKYFSLRDGIERYWQIYRRLLSA